MNLAIQGDHSSTVQGLPIKRKRGRPRKDQSINRMNTLQMPPGFGGVKEEQPQRADSVIDASDRMVGQAVTGVIEASFDAGYLLSVRIGSSGTNFRGVVFKPGHYAPVTAENDVAPHVQTIRRNDIHVHRNNRSRNNTARNGSSSANQIRALADRTTNTATSRGRYSAPTAPSVPPVGVRGTVVPVVLQPASVSNGFTPTLQVPCDTSQEWRNSDEVKPLAMLPPDPARQRPVAQDQSLPSQTHASQQVAQGSALNENDSSSEMNMTGQHEEGKPIKSAETRAADELTRQHQGSPSSSEIDAKDSKEADESLSGKCFVLDKKSFEDLYPQLRPQPIPVSQPLVALATGRMTELLLALQENVTENQAHHAEHPSARKKQG